MLSSTSSRLSDYSLVKEHELESLLSFVPSQVSCVGRGNNTGAHCCVNGVCAVFLQANKTVANCLLRQFFTFFVWKPSEMGVEIRSAAFFFIAARP
jgi:hypothetical protein